MPKSSSLRLVQLTPPGRGAVATLLVEGPGAADLVEAQFRAKSGRSLTAHPEDRLVFGHFQSDSGEEVVVRRRGQDAVELHCHGGWAAVAMIRDRLERLGCRTIGWQSWVAADDRDPLVSAARIALADARTLRTAAILLDQYHGALRRELGEIEAALGRNDEAQATARIDALLARAELGRHLVRPWQVVLAGRPNVGKSSLVNALLGYTRAIVHHEPGTTRDAVGAATAIDGWPLQLSDTAGLHAGDDPVERAGMELARKKLATADLVVLVFDSAETWSESDRTLLQSRPDALVVHNKSDLPPPPGWRPPGVATSALTGDGVEALARAIADRLVPHPPPPGAAVPLDEEQAALVAAYSRR